MRLIATIPATIGSDFASADEGHMGGWGWGMAIFGWLFERSSPRSSGDRAPVS